MAGQEKKAGVAVKVVLAFAVVLVAAICVFGVAVYSSYQRIMPLAERIEAAADTIEDRAQAYDIEGAVSALAEIDSSINGIAAELDGDVWGVAERVPVLGEDVHGARTLVAVSQNVMATTVMPVSGVVQELPSGVLNSLGKLLGVAMGTAPVEFTLSNASDVADALAGFDGMVETLLNAAPNLEMDAWLLSTLGDFHFAELNEARDELVILVDGLRDALNQIKPALEGYANTKQAIGEAVDAGNQAVSQMADAAGQALGEAADAAGQALEQAADAAEQAFADASKKVEDFADGAKAFGEDVKDFAYGIYNAIWG